MKTIFSKKSKSHTTDDDDSDEMEFRCIGDKGMKMLERDGIALNKDGRSHQKTSIDSPGPVSSRSEPKPKPGQLQRTVSTEKICTTYKPTSLGSGSSSADSLTSRSTAALSVASPNRSRSPYGNSSAAGSFLNPRSIQTVYNKREGGTARPETGSSGDNSNVSEYRGRHGRNARREYLREPE